MTCRFLQHYQNFFHFQNSSFDILNAVLNRAKIEPEKLLSVNIKEKYIVLGIDYGDSFLKNCLALSLNLEERLLHSQIFGN